MTDCTCAPVQAADPVPPLAAGPAVEAAAQTNPATSDSTVFAKAGDALTENAADLAAAATAALPGWGTLVLAGLALAVLALALVGRRTSRIDVGRIDVTARRARPHYRARR